MPPRLATFNRENLFDRAGQLRLADGSDLWLQLNHLKSQSFTSGTRPAAPPGSPRCRLR